MKDIVLVHWGDAWFSNHTGGTEDKPLAQLNVGFVISKNEEGITIAAEYQVEDPDEFRHVMFIPWVNITNLEVLEDAEL